MRYFLIGLAIGRLLWAAGSVYGEEYFGRDAR